MLTTAKARSRLARYRANFEDSESVKLAKCLLFLKDICGWEPYGHQVYYVSEMLKKPYNLIYAPPRAGKTMAIEGVILYWMATNLKEDYRIYVPKYDQGKDALNYHYNWISRSKILMAFLEKHLGKPMLARTEYRFSNGSNSKIYSIRGEIEGHNCTVAHIEEFDDWTWEKFANDVMRRFGAKNENGLETRVNISGTIMGQENIYKVATDQSFSIFKNLSQHPELGIIDAHLLVALGVLDRKAVELQRLTMSPDEWARSGLLQFTEASSFIFMKYFRDMMKRVLMWKKPLKPVVFQKGGKYKPKGKVAVGIDCGHAGQKETSSWYTMHFVEEIKGYKRWLNSFRWSPDYNPKKWKEEVVDILSFYQPAGGYGDALKMNDIMDINDMAYSKGLTSKNPMNYPEMNPSNWEKWWISPLHNHGQNKHEMYSAVQNAIHSGKLLTPYYDKSDKSEGSNSLLRLIRNLENIRVEKTAGHIPKYFGINKKIGDDEADAFGMVLKWINENTEIPVNPDLLQGSGNKTMMSQSLPKIKREAFSKNDAAGF
jgi:hypothetical protein